MHLIRPEAAVEADRIGSQPFQQGGRRRNVPAGEKTAVLVENQRGKDGKAGRLPRGQNRRLEFIGVAHGFNENAVRSSLFACRRHAAKKPYRLVERQIAEGLEKPPCWADVHRHPDLLRGSVGFPPGKGHTGGNNVG